ncbi:MAG: sigma-54-dependent Fis family transcriptional regulator [Planctomycetota bacterium]
MIENALDEFEFFAQLIQSLRSRGNKEFTTKLLPLLVQVLRLKGAGTVRQRSGDWQIKDWSGTSSAGEIPIDRVSDAVDEEEVRSVGEWTFVPFRSDEEGFLEPTVVGCLVLQRSEDSPPREPLTQVAELFVHAMAHADADDHRRARIGHLSDLLEAAAEWQQIPLQNPSDDEALLRRIADTATRLLHCQRASIFLWDKRRKKLIGRPALGIDDRPLEVPDDAGVVGEVLFSKEPTIWNGNSDDESRVNRDVDRSLEFDTRSLVAVPLFGRRGETIGVFEAINHEGSGFSDSDALLLTDLALHASVAIEAHRAQKSLTESRDRLVRDAASSSPLIGDHAEIEAIRQSASKVAKTELTVLIRGGNGTGKEVLARHVHYESDRRNGPFIAVNCAALVESLLESELFGHEKGAFTDANSTRVGKFELASGGTLFLDEVGDMSPGGQAKLLRVLEQREVVRVGGSNPIPVDVRVIAATNQPLEDLIAEKRFREDLFFRLNVVSLVLPDLASRGNDVLLLARHFLTHFCYEIGRQVPTFSESAQTALLSHRWPGNVRELRNTIERVCYLITDEEITANDLEIRSRPVNGHQNDHSVACSAPSLAESTRQFQIGHIRRAIERSGGNMTEAATRLELHRSNLYRKMKQLGMQTGLPDPPEEDASDHR